MAKFRIRTEKDILSLDGYVRDVVPEEDPIAEFVDDYYVPVPVQCGLRACHTWHNEGAILKTASGAVTNVGHICGRRFRGYDEKYDEFKKAKLVPCYQGEIVGFKRKGSEVTSALQKIEARSEVLFAKVANFNSTFPGLGNTLRQRAMRSETAVQTVVERSEQEIENAMASSPGLTRERARYKSETVGHVQGLAAFLLQPLDFQQLRTEIQQVMDLDVINCSFTKLSRGARWIEDFEAKYQQYQNVISAGEAFFTAANLGLLGYLAMPEGEKARLAIIDVASLSRRQLVESAVVPQKKQETKPLNEFEKLVKSLAKSIYGQS